MIELSELKESKRSPWPFIVVSVITFTIAVVIARVWWVMLVLFVLLLLNLSWRLGSRVKATHDGGFLLNYGSGMTWFAIISAFILATLFSYSAMFRPAAPGSDVVSLATILMAIFMSTWLPFIEGTFSWFIVNDRGIDKHSAWSRHFFMRWDEIGSIDFTAVNQWFVIRGSKGSLHLHAYLIGLPEFAKEVQKHVPPERWVKTKALIEALAGGARGDDWSKIVEGKQDGDSAFGEKTGDVKVETSEDAAKTKQ